MKNHRVTFVYETSVVIKVQNKMPIFYFVGSVLLYIVIFFRGQRAASPLLGGRHAQHGRT